MHRLPKSVLEVSKKMLNGFSRNPVAASAEREAGWLLLASLLASMPKEVLKILCPICKTCMNFCSSNFFCGHVFRSWKTRCLMFFYYGLVPLLEIPSHTFAMCRIGHQNCGLFFINY